MGNLYEIRVHRRLADAAHRGTLDFSLIGILAPIAQLLAEAKIGTFVVSTYDTDYVLVKEAQFSQAVEVLAGDTIDK